VGLITKDEALERLAEQRRQLLGGEAGCVMCALAREASSLPPVAESQYAVVRLNRLACKYGHLLVIPRVHVERLSQVPWEVFSDVQRLTWEAACSIDSCLEPPRVFAASLGATVDLSMTYAHYHVHIIPVPETDERARPARVLSWSEGVVVYEDDEALELCRRLREAWPARDIAP
jgi:histidine triad (HIT) family protein